jgi:hypothetical protein
VDRHDYGGVAVALQSQAVYEKPGQPSSNRNGAGAGRHDGKLTVGIAQPKRSDERCELSLSLRLTGGAQFQGLSLSSRFTGAGAQSHDYAD